MTRATLRARLGATAACLIAGASIALAPAAMAKSPGSTTAADNSGTQHRIAVHQVHSSREARLLKRHDQLVRKVIREARRQKGKPYVYGDDGPHAFDCSGLVRFVFMHSVHRTLPHNAAEQYHSLRHISRKRLRPGDLIFTDNGYISHVGIFAGHHHWWVAPQTGTRVQLQRIYHAHFRYARVLVIHHH
jgi:cell wall-associated NlpC family hydrolase